MNTTVVICTYNRPDDLDRCLSALTKSTIPPSKVLIVDQGDVEVTQKIVHKYGLFDVDVLESETASLTRARNLGFKFVKTLYVLFIDDDVILGKEYIKHGEAYLKINEQVHGVNGRDKVYHYSQNRFRSLVGALLGISSQADFNKVLGSGLVVLRNQAQEVQSIEWLSGCNMFYRSGVLREYTPPFEPRFLRWSSGEDVWTSHRMYLDHPGCLRYLPGLNFEHRQSPVARMPSHQQARMSMIHHYLFVYTILPSGFVKRSLYWWGVVWYVVWMTIQERSFALVSTRLSTLKFLIKRGESLRAGTDFNQYIFHD